MNQVTGLNTDAVSLTSLEPKPKNTVKNHLCHKGMAGWEKLILEFRKSIAIAVEKPRKCNPYEASENLDSYDSVH